MKRNDPREEAHPTRKRHLTKEEHLYGIFADFPVQPQPLFLEENPIGFVKSKTTLNTGETSKLKIINLDEDITFVKDNDGNKSNSTNKKVHFSDQIEIINPPDENADKGNSITEGKTNLQKFYFGERAQLPNSFGTIRSSKEAVNESLKVKEIKLQEQKFQNQYGKGAKILKNFGFKPGDVMGDSVVGISVPIVPQKRPERLGLNYNGYTEHRPCEKEEPKSPKKEPELPQWKRGVPDPQRKQRKEEQRKQSSNFRELKQEWNSMYNISPTIPKKMQIIDMTKPALGSDINVEAHPHLSKMRQRVHFFASQTAIARKTLEQSVASLENDLVLVQYESKTLGNKISHTETEIENEEQFLEEYKQIFELSKDIDQSGCMKLCQKYPQFCEQYKIPELITKQFLFLLKKEFHSWTIPSESAELLYLKLQEFKTLIYEICSIIQDRKVQQSIPNKAEELFLYLISEIWMPQICSFINTEWNLREPEALIEFIELYTNIIPNSIILQLKHNCIIPILQRAAEVWDTCGDPLPVHLWIYPWLPTLGIQALTPVIEIIMDKITSVLPQWSPEDDSVFFILKPWKEILPIKTWNAIIRIHILPKLAMAVNSLEINPADQSLEPLKNLFLWMPLIELEDIKEILLNNFFPRWLHTIKIWIERGPNRKELAIWYSGWRDFLPLELVQTPEVQACFEQALSLFELVL